MSSRSSQNAMLQVAEEYLRRRRLREALMAFDGAEGLGADSNRCAGGRWLVHMLLGEFESAWRQSDVMRGRIAPDPHRFWQGESLRNRRVIVRCLHGLGDAVQFLRYAPALQNCAAEMIVEVPPTLLELAPCFKGVEHVISWGRHAPAVSPRWDVQLEINELSYVFRTQPEDLPVAARYLNLPMKEVDSVRPANPDNLRVGVVWTSGEWNSARSTPFDLLEPMIRTPGCEFWNLQGGTARNAWKGLGCHPYIHNADECANSVLKLAGVIAQLDLIITTDTLAAHLAGALDTPAWVMLEYAADWRWQHARQDSPWYRSLHLFRQHSAGDWSSVTEEIRTALRGAVSSHQMRGAA